MARPRKSGFESHGYKYKDHYPELLIQTMREGDSYVAFCAEVGIGKTTFFEWLNAYPEFDAAYERAIALAQVWWEKKMQEKLITGGDEKFNTTGWSIVMRNRFGHTEHRKIRVKGISKAKTLSDKFKVLGEMLERGELTANESVHLMNFLSGGAKLLESSEMLTKMERLEALLSEKGGNDVASIEAKASED